MPDRDFDAAHGRWFYTAYELIDALVKQRLSGTEWDLFWFIVRYAYGNNKKAYTDLKWSFIKKETGLSGGTISKARNKLQERNILKCFPQETKTTVRYRINSKPSTWKSVSHRKPVSHRKQKGFPQETTPIKKTIKKGVWGAINPTGAFLKKDNPWLDESAWNDFVLHRENINQELTPLALTKVLNLLNRYTDHQAFMIDATIVNNWRGIFPPKGGTSKKAARSMHERKLEKWKRRYNEQQKNERT